MNNNDHANHDRETKQLIIANVEKFGCHLAMLEADNYLPAFVYSIGLYKNFNHPEIICFGLSTQLMATLINDARDMIRKGQKLTTGELYPEFLTGYNVQFIEVDKAYYCNYLGYANWFYDWDDSFPVLQLVWPDKQQLFPWDENFNPDWKFKQPLLDRNTDFKFYEKRNTCVFTTKQAFDGDPILYVYHNEDGAWQFHTSLEPNLDDAKMVALEQITKLDPSINEIYHLQYGWCAWRSSGDADWEFAEDEEADEDDE